MLYLRRSVSLSMQLPNGRSAFSLAFEWLGINKLWTKLWLTINFHIQRSPTPSLSSHTILASKTYLNDTRTKQNSWIKKTKQTHTHTQLSTTVIRQIAFLDEFHIPRKVHGSSPYASFAHIASSNISCHYSIVTYLLVARVLHSHIPTT